MSRFGMMGLLTVAVLSLGLNESFAQTRATTTNTMSSGTRAGTTGNTGGGTTGSSAFGNQSNSAFGNQSSFGNQNSAFGNQNSALGGNQNSTFGNQNSAFGNQNSSTGNRTGLQNSTNTFGNTQNTGTTGQQGMGQQQQGTGQQGFGQQGGNTGLGNTGRNALGGGGGRSAFGGGALQFNPFQAAGQKAAGPGIQPSLRLGFQPPTRAPGQVSDNLENRMQQVAARPSRMTEIKPELNGVKVNVANDGVVTLRGEVATESARRLAANMIRMEPGVRRVVNELAVAPTPPVPAN